MSGVLTAKRYAAAVLRLAQNDEEIQRQRDFFDAAVKLFHIEASRRVLLSPAMPKSLKKKLLDYASESAGVRQAVQPLSDFLLRVNRVNLIPEIREELLELIARRRGEVRLEVVTAAEISSDRGELVAAGVARATGKRVVLVQKQDPGVIGGLVLRFDNKVLDLSVRSRVKKILKNAAL